MNILPIVFDIQLVLTYLSSLDGDTTQYNYYLNFYPTNATEYAAAMVWSDVRTMPTWSYIYIGGAGWDLYVANYLIQIAVRQDIESGLEALNSTLAPVATAGSYASLTGKPSLAAVALTGAYSDLSGKPSRSASIVSRSLNSSFQVSSSRDSMVSYSVESACTISLVTGQSNTISLQISSNNTTFSEVARFVNGNTGSLTIGLNLTQTVCQPLSAMVPAGYYVKIVTSGTGTATYRVGQETLF